MLAYVMKKPGSIENLEITEVKDPEPKKGHVLIEVKAFGLNRSELYTIQGHSGDAVTYPRILGIECVGTVIDSGETDLKIGQTVAAAMGFMGRKYDGGYAEKALIPRENVYPIDTDISWEILGGLPETYLTAWGVVKEAIDIKSKQTILVRGATSSVGMAAISIAKDLDCTVIATTRNESKIDSLKQAGADEIIIDRGSIKEELLKKHPNGVNAVVELVGRKETILESLQCTAPKVTVGLVGFLGNSWDYEFFPWMPSTVKLTLYNSETLSNEYATPVLQNIVNKIEQGKYKATIYKQFKFKELKEALKIMENSKAAGKLVITI